MPDLPTVERYLVIYLSREDFRRSIRAAVRSLYFGYSDLFGFSDGMLRTIERNFERAWQEGARACGILPDERSAEENDALNRFIFEQAPYLSGFGQAILNARAAALAADEEPNSRKGRRRLRPLFQRADIWVNRYNEVVNMATSMACSDRKLKWVLGMAEHCSTCMKLNGKVKRGSVWTASGIRPQMRDLECGGYNCKCDLIPTDEPASMGPLPRVP